MAGRTVRLTHCVQAVSYYSLLNSFLYLPCADFYIASSELCRESRQQFRMQVSDCPISSPACLDQRLRAQLRLQGGRHPGAAQMASPVR